MEPIREAKQPNTARLPDCHMRAALWFVVAGAGLGAALNTPTRAPTRLAQPRRPAASALAARQVLYVAMLMFVGGNVCLGLAARAPRGLGRGGRRGCASRTAAVSPNRGAGTCKVFAARIAAPPRGATWMLPSERAARTKIDGREEVLAGWCGPTVFAGGVGAPARGVSRIFRGQPNARGADEDREGASKGRGGG